MKIMTVRSLVGVLVQFILYSSLLSYLEPVSHTFTPIASLIYPLLILIGEYSTNVEIIPC